MAAPAAAPPDHEPVTPAQRAYLDAFDRFLRADGPAKLAARHDMRASLADMCADAGIPVPRAPREYVRAGRHGPKHDRDR